MQGIPGLRGKAGAKGPLGEPAAPLAPALASAPEVAGLKMTLILNGGTVLSTYARPAVYVRIIAADREWISPVLQLADKRGLQDLDWDDVVVNFTIPRAALPTHFKVEVYQCTRFSCEGKHDASSRLYGDEDFPYAQFIRSNPVSKQLTVGSPGVNPGQATIMFNAQIIDPALRSENGIMLAAKVPPLCRRMRAVKIRGPAMGRLQGYQRGSPKQCQVLCNAKKGCAVWTWDALNQRCFLLEGMTRIDDDIKGGWVSGEKCVNQYHKVTSRRSRSRGARREDLKSGTVVVPPWGPQTKCVDVKFSCPFPPRHGRVQVQLTIDHRQYDTNGVNDPTTAWVETITREGFKACVSELPQYDGQHAALSLTYMAYRRRPAGTKRGEISVRQFMGTRCVRINFRSPYQVVPKIILTANRRNRNTFRRWRDFKGVQPPSGHHTPVSTWIEEIDARGFRACASALRPPQDPKVLHRLVPSLWGCMKSVCIFVCLRMCVCVCAYVCLRVCVYIYVCVCIIILTCVIEFSHQYELFLPYLVPSCHEGGKRGNASHSE
jgi:hypothetical protein